LSIAARRARPNRAASSDDSGQEAKISSLTSALAKVEGEHAAALQWFSDLHSLFDLGMLAIDPETRKVVLADSLAGTSYADLEGRSIAVPHDPASSPSQEALAQHFNWTGIARLSLTLGSR
jgi:hypothetical protein